MSEPKSRRIPKPIWFGVAAVLMVVLYVFLAVWYPYHREQIAIREIERLGGGVSLFWDGPRWIEDGPGWMQEVVNDGWLSWFDRVCAVNLTETTVSDEKLKNHLEGMTNLTSLILTNTRVSNEGMKHLSGLNNLTGLFLGNTQVGDEGVEHLSGLTNLFILDLGNTHVSNEGLKHLSGFTNLYRVDLYNTKVTEEGINELQKALPDCFISY